MQIKTNDVHETVCAEKVKYPHKKPELQGIFKTERVLLEVMQTIHVSYPIQI